MLRLSPPAHGRLRSASQLDLHVAGAEANVAVALAALGVEAAFVSALPATPLGDRAAADLAAAGVDLGFLDRPAAGRIGLFFVEFGAGARPTTVWYDRSGSAFAQMERYDPAALDGARLAVTSGITLAISAAARRLAEAFVAAARERGVEVCVDVNFRARLSSPEQARERLEPILRQAQIVVCSRRDAKLVFGIAAAERELVAVQLRDRFAPEAAILVVTDGVNGCVGLADGTACAQAAIKTDPVDRIGAGDAFLAGLLWGRLRGEPLPAALRFAAALGALKCTVEGDQALFTPAEVEAAAAGERAVLVR
ncbi:MAG: sugar kinase [Actinobacteria bacterium]|nr:sugar kinase [Actinomycetota bacterium]